jgi:CubicO group peptidase (beta-lactamase class C family)
MGKLTMNRKYFLLVFVLLAGLSSCHVVRFFVWNFADIHDNRKFAKTVMHKAEPVFRFAEAGGEGACKLPHDVTVSGHTYLFDDYLKKTKTVAFIVIRNDSVMYKKYLYGYSDASEVPSFSMAKSFTSMLVGVAIGEGKIGSVHDPINKYLTELTAPGFEKITIEHLLDMRSGLRSNEGYVNPFGDLAKFYYGTNLRKYIKQIRINGAPGEQFEYKSVNAQLLGMIVERATGKQLARYMEEKIWQYIGAEYDASWSVDSKRNDEPKAFCCFNAHALDFAKLGRLYLEHGNWNGRQLVPEKWVQQSVSTAGNKNGNLYSYQWWHNRAIPGMDFFAQGLLGQFVYVYPSKHMIIVRLGKTDKLNAWPHLFREVAEKN